MMTYKFFYSRLNFFTFQISRYVYYIKILLSLVFKIKKKISKKVNLILIRLFVKNDMILLLCLLVKFNLKRIKGIEPKNSKKFKVIVLSKSGGIDDLICSQQKYNKTLNILILIDF